VVTTLFEKPLSLGRKGDHVILEYTESEEVSLPSCGLKTSAGDPISPSCSDPVPSAGSGLHSAAGAASKTPQVISNSTRLSPKVDIVKKEDKSQDPSAPTAVTEVGLSCA